jgi:hypothetical protein
VSIDLPQPRTVETRELVRYFQLVTEVREALRRHEPAAAADRLGADVADAIGQTSLGSEADAERVRAEGLG